MHQMFNRDFSLEDRILVAFTFYVLHFLLCLNIFHNYYALGMKKIFMHWV